MPRVKDLIHEIVRSQGVTYADARADLRSVAEAMAAMLARGEAVRLPGVGLLAPVLRPPRRCRDFASGALIDVPARVEVRFRPASDLKENL